MGKPQNILKPVLNVSVDHCKTKLMSGMWRDKFLLLYKERDPEACNSAALFAVISFKPLQKSSEK